MTIYLQALFIFLARILDVSMGTVRTILLVKGNRKIASVIGFFEVMIFLLVLGNVVGNINKPILIIAYCSGFACGNFVGGKLEEKLSIGKVSAEVILKENVEEVIQALRNEGFGVTIFEGMGLEGKSYMMNIILERKNIKKFREIMGKTDPNAFITIFDIRASAGGHFVPIKK